MIVNSFTSFSVNDIMVHRRMKTMTTIRKDLTGMRFGKLTVIKYLHQDKYHRSVWECKCDCGNVVSRTLPRRFIFEASCGCGIHFKEKDRLIAGRKATAYNIMRQATLMFQRGQTRKEMLLTHEEVMLLIDKPCAYCGRVAVGRFNHGTMIRPEYYAHNGIDRVDSNKPYTKNNVVPCCPICNQMKMELPYSEFIEQVHRISKHAKGKV